MTALELIAGVERIGGELSLRGERIHYRLPGETPAADAARLLAELRAHKQELLAALSERAAHCGSPNCAGCYEVSPGVRIHPPRASRDYLEWFDRWRGSGAVN